jgi:hypothetical protein
LRTWHLGHTHLVPVVVEFLKSFPEIGPGMGPPHRPAKCPGPPRRLGGDHCLCESGIRGLPVDVSGLRVELGHRHNILGITSCFTNAGAGFAPPRLIRILYQSPWPSVFVPNTGDNLYTVEFVTSAGGSNGYTPPVISAAAPAPTGQSLLSIDATPSSPQPGSTAVQLSATYDATVYGLPNDIRQVWIYPTATRGEQANCPAGTPCPAIMGQLPFGAGAFPCPVTKGADPNIPSCSCAASVPNGPLGMGLVIIALDNYGNALYRHAPPFSHRRALTHRPEDAPPHRHEPPFPNRTARLC